MDAELLELERAFWVGDPDVYQNHTTEGCVMVFGEPVGALNKEQVIDAIARAPRWASVEIEDARTISFAPHVILLIYRAAARQADGTPYPTMASSVYVRGAEGWKLAFHQQSPPQTFGSERA